MDSGIVLHIGTNKTGTSALQRFCNERRGDLARHGLLYPGTGCLGEAHYELAAALGFSHAPAPDPAACARIRQELRAALDAELAYWRPRLILFSAEDFMLPGDIAGVRSFFAGHAVRILVYLRRHDRWWESAYAEATRQVPDPPWAPGPAAFIDWHRQHDPRFGDYRALLDRWAAVFGAGRIVVRPYEHRQNQPDLLADFLTAIGAGALLNAMPCVCPRVNPSLSPLAVQLADLFQRLTIPAELKRRLVAHAQGLDDGTPRVPLLPPAARRALIDEHAAVYADIARNFLGRPDGRLFHDPLPDPGAPWAPPPPPSPRQAVEAALRAAGLLDEIS